MDLGDQEWLLALCSDGDIGPAGVRLGRELESLGLGDGDVARFSELVEGVWWSTEADAAGLQLTLDTVERALACAVPAGLAPVALHYIRAVCEEAWELSWEHAPLFAVMEQALAGEPTALAPAIAHFRSPEEDDWVSQTSADELRSHRRAMEAVRDAAD